MGDEEPVLGFVEEEAEGVEGPGRAHPGELVGTQIGAGLEALAHSPRGCAHVDAVGRDHEIEFALIARIDTAGLDCRI